MIEKIFEIEDKVKKWIETERFKWYSLIVSLGVVLEVGVNLSLGGSYQQGFVMSSVYSFILVLAEVSLGGEGLRD
ncbi:hypothetical protein M1146_08245 [Patescibacteria group bacterium]|nr:hypothetical protein [Patescibacteria group bacterium]